MKAITHLIIIATLIISFNVSAQSQELKPFKSDFCSAWPEGQGTDPTQWADCCFTHDLHYWLGGSQEERKEADKELRSCVKLTGASIASFLMYLGVRLGGQPGDANFAWSYGWTENRGYEAVSAEGLETAKTLLESSEYNQNEATKPLVAAFLEDVLTPKLEEALNSSEID